MPAAKKAPKAEEEGQRLSEEAAKKMMEEPEEMKAVVSEAEEAKTAEHDHSVATRTTWKN